MKVIATISQNTFYLESRFTEREREQERTEDALASETEEGRGKLRKVAGICKQELIREYPNGETRQVEDLSPPRGGAYAGN